MRIRLPFAGVFFVLLALAGYAGLTSLQVGLYVNDKVLHFVTFFLLTLAFYWIVDTTRRRTLNAALVVCTLGLGVGSEVLQAAIPNNGRLFDALDIAANIAGSLGALGLCTWYHKRMLERKRQRRYSAVPGDEPAEGDDEGDIELVDAEAAPDLERDGTTTTTAASSKLSAPAVAAPATGSAASSAPAAPRTTSLEDELDNWDENAEDPWDEADGDLGGSIAPRPAKKHAD